MATEISQRELRNDSGRIMRSLSSGETFTVTSNGEPVGELTPLRRRRFVSAASVIEMFRGAPEVDAARFRQDLDDLADQDIEPRG
ncbi:MAG: type II toxin-antitoxin system Phd/YefM family antitoxin [Microthrixaceae bacterium]